MHKKKLKSIFLGSRIEAYKVLDKLTNVIGIIPIKNSYVHKNKKNIIFFSNKKNCKKINIFLKNSDADLILSSGYPFKIPKNILMSKKIFINSHPGYLPKYKGKKSIPDAYKKNEKYIGCTVHYINEKIDDGKIISKKSVNIEGLRLDEVYNLVFSKLEPEVIKESLNKIINTLYKF